MARERDLRSVHAGSDRAPASEPSVQESGELPALLVIHAIRPAHDRGGYLLRVHVQGQRSAEVEYEDQGAVPCEQQSLYEVGVLYGDRLATVGQMTSNTVGGVVAWSCAPDSIAQAPQVAELSRW